MDVNWFGPGGAGQVNDHFGQVGVCPTGPQSCIHTITFCGGNMTWAINNVCAGWTVTLLNEDFTPAPAVLPPNWSGHTCITADNTVAVGSTCCFSVDFVCAGVTATINVCAIACECPTPAVPETWNRIKTLYR